METKELLGIGRTWLFAGLLSVLVFVLVLTGKVPPDAFIEFATWIFGLAAGSKAIGKFGLGKLLGGK